MSFIRLKCKNTCRVLEYVKKLGFEEELYKIQPMVDGHPVIDRFEVKQACKEPLTPSSK